MPTDEFDNGFVLYVGAMFGGKTAQAIIDGQRAEIANKKTLGFKTNWDNRYSEGFITANNNQLKFPAKSVSNTKTLIELVENENPQIVIIDEIHFFDEKIYDFINEYKHKARIIATGLQFDYRGNSFRLRTENGKEFDSDKIDMGKLMGISTKIKQFWPICMSNEVIPCGPAYYNQRFDENGCLSKYSAPTIVIGNHNKYKALCDKHFVRPLPDDTFLTPDKKIITYEETKKYSQY